MLILTRGVGQAIYIGDDICVVVHERMVSQVTLGVLSPAKTLVHYAGEYVAPAVFANGEQFYLITLRNNEDMRINDSSVHVNLSAQYLSSTGQYPHQVRIGVIAPRAIPVHREEIYRRIQQQAGKRPPLSFAEWLRNANASVCSRMAV